MCSCVSAACATCECLACACAVRVSLCGRCVHMCQWHVLCACMCTCLRGVCVCSMCCACARASVACAVHVSLHLWRVHVNVCLCRVPSVCTRVCGLCPQCARARLCCGCVCDWGVHGVCVCAHVCVYWACRGCGRSPCPGLSRRWCALTVLCARRVRARRVCARTRVCPQARGVHLRRLPRGHGCAYYGGGGGRERHRVRAARSRSPRGCSPCACAGHRGGAGEATPPARGP